MNIEDATYHDNPIHSIEFIDENYNTDLVLDIDYISEWINADGNYQFRISPAYLTFKEVSNLNICINKPALTQHGYLETILDIKTKLLESGSTKYTISLLPDSYIEFCSSGSTLEIEKKEFIKNVQYLTKAERERAYIRRETTQRPFASSARSHKTPSR